MTSILSPIDATEHESIVTEAMVTEVALMRWRHRRLMLVTATGWLIAATLAWSHAKAYLGAALG